jgi:hypothetical protein
VIRISALAQRRQDVLEPTVLRPRKQQEQLLADRRELPRGRHPVGRQVQEALRVLVEDVRDADHEELV